MLHQSWAIEENTLRTITQFVCNAGGSDWQASRPGPAQSDERGSSRLAIVSIIGPIFTRPSVFQTMLAGTALTEAK